MLIDKDLLANKADGFVKIHQSITQSSVLIFPYPSYIDSSILRATLNKKTTS